MQSTMFPLTASLPPTPFVFDPASLYARLRILTDGRAPRGLRYPLAALLTNDLTLGLVARRDTRTWRKHDASTPPFPITLSPYLPRPDFASALSA